MDPKNIDIYIYIDMFCLLAELENKMCGYPLSLGNRFLVQKCSPRTKTVWAGHPCKRLFKDGDWALRIWTCWKNACRKHEILELPL